MHIIKITVSIVVFVLIMCVESTGIEINRSALAEKNRVSLDAVYDSDYDSMKAGNDAMPVNPIRSSNKVSNSNLLREYIPEKTIADISDFQLLGSLGGMSNALAINGRYIYVGKGTSVIILENSDDTLIQTNGQLAFGSLISDIMLKDDTLYVAAGQEGVYIVDISDLQSPVVEGHFTSEGFAEALAVRDGLLYIANGSLGLSVVNIANPVVPILVESIATGQYACDGIGRNLCVYCCYGQRSIHS